jgi:protease I
MPKKLKNLKVALLFTDGFEQVEMSLPKKALEEAGANTDMICPQKKIKGAIHDQPGDEFHADVLLDEADPNQYDALVLPGGVANPDKLRTLPKAVEFVKHFFKNNKPVAAICHGPWTLINAEVVKGRTLTSWYSLKMDLINAGAKWVDQEVVRDGNLVTSRKPDDIPAFNKTIIELLAGAKS